MTQTGYPVSAGTRTTIDGARRTISLDDCHGIIDVSDELDLAWANEACEEILLVERGRIGKVYQRDPLRRWISYRPS